MKTVFLVTLTLTALLCWTPALTLADEPQSVPVPPDKTQLPPLPEEVDALLSGNATSLDAVLDFSLAPTISAKIYFRTNDDAGIAFFAQILVTVKDGQYVFPNAFDGSTVLRLRQIKPGGTVEEWVNEPLLKKLSEEATNKKRLDL